MLNTEKLDPYIDLAGRLLIIILFLLSGFSKITGYAGMQGYMEMMGVPGILLPLAILLEVGGGLAIVFGWKTRIVAFLFAGYSLLTAVIFHNQLGDQMQFMMFMKNISIAGGFLFLAQKGAGAFSLDSRRK